MVEWTDDKVRHPHQTSELVFGLSIVGFIILIVATAIASGLSGEEINNTYGTIVMVSLLGIVICGCGFLAT